MSRVYTVFVGNTSPSLADVITVAGAAQDLTGAAVRFRMRAEHSAALKVDAAAVLVTPAAGAVRYDWAAGDLDTAGRYRAWWQVTFGNGRVQDTPEFSVDVEAHTPLDVTGAGVSVGPCEAWCSAADVDAAYPGGEPGDYADWAVAASQILFELTARQFPGVCTHTVRPCSSVCRCWVDAESPPVSSPSVGFGRCGCGSVSSVLLPAYPVRSVVEVRIDGAVLSSAAYEVLDYAYLVRIDGEGWPVGQDLNAAAGSVGTWSVAYTAGVAPPEIGRLASIELAYHLARAGRGETCGLPQGARKVVRQGVTVDRQAVVFLARELKAGASSGLVAVDTLVATYNPAGVRRAAAVWTPDRPSVGRRRTA